MQKYKGIIDKVYYTNGSWSSIRLGIAEKKKIKQYINAAGAITNPIEGFEIEMEAEEVIDPKYGLQLKVSKSEVKKSSSSVGVLSFLSSGLISGIGPTMAERIFEKFGRKSLKVIEETPELLLDIKGISKKKLEKICKSYDENTKYFEIYKTLNGKVTPNQAMKLFERYGLKTEKVLKEDPYRIIYEVDGFGFLKADEIAKSSGIPLDSPKRVGAALIYVLKTKSEKGGHCYVNSETLQEEGIRLLVPFEKILEDKKKQKKLEEDLLAYADIWDEKKEDFINKYKLDKVQIENVEKWIAVREHYIDVMAFSLSEEIKAERIIFDEENDAIYWSELYEAEAIVAELVVYMTQNKSVKTITEEEVDAAIKNGEYESGYELGEEQKRAVHIGSRNRLSIITGGPGRGKTTIIKRIIDAWNDDESVILCAPTGRAAQRMKEATGHDASTIHQVLMKYSIEEKIKRTGKEFYNPKFENALIIIDETSMIDISLAAKVMVMAKNNNLVFVGDVDQLPSIGPGNFFSDLIKSKVVPTAWLTKGYRNEGSLSSNAERINSGKPNKYLIYDANFRYVYAEKEYAANKIIEVYDEMLEKYEMKDICIIAPMRKRSATGITELNKIIREHVNPYKKGMETIKNVDFRIGDRVMNTSNNTKKEVEKDGITQLGIFNGDCGSVIKIDSEEDEITILFDDGRVGIFSSNEIKEFELAFAITIHKSQGSEYKAIIIAMNKEHFIMLKRNLLYTAVTRGKNIVTIVGEKQAIDIAIRNTDYKLRNSQLRNKIIEEKIKYGTVLR